MDIVLKVVIIVHKDILQIIPINTHLLLLDKEALMEPGLVMEQEGQEEEATTLQEDLTTFLLIKNNCKDNNTCSFKSSNNGEILILMKCTLLKRRVCKSLLILLFKN